MESWHSLLEAMISNPGWISELYNQYREDPSRVDTTWKELFQNVSLRQEKFLQTASNPSKQEPLSSHDDRLSRLIDAYRSYGHLAAHINPIQAYLSTEPKELSIEAAGFTSKDLTTYFPTYDLLPVEHASLENILQALRKIYCGTIGFEYMGLQNPDLERWMQQKIERFQFKNYLSLEQKKNILHSLNRSELFESFLHTKYVGQKRFSLEGGETLIPMLDALLETAAEIGMQDLVLGMAHRGRLNVLANILNKSYSAIFSEFEENYIPNSFEGSGDVKYHKGFSSVVKTHTGKQVKVILTSNPSHLESVDPVVEGMVKGKQLLAHNSVKAAVPVLIHGDASLTGQGIVYETLQFSNLKGYSTGGTIHIVVNNQIGFTTLPEDGRSTRYCTDIARAFGAPTFHVNAEDPEVCVFAAILAVELRQQFHCDVFIDLNCYRKYGHNESDEPAFTQPLEYKLIRAKRPVREIYRDQLIEQGIVERQIAEKLEEEFTQALHVALETSKEEIKQSKSNHSQSVSQQVIPEKPMVTAVSEQVIADLALKMNQLPEQFQVHRKLIQLYEERCKSLNQPFSQKAIDWGTGEMLAYATLLYEGHGVRLSGQDVIRGTFSHRHAVLVDQEQEQTYSSLQHLSEKQGKFSIYNSPLSEYGVLGFEYGYSMSGVEGLVIWEAQFGDFANGAQVMIDQYIATAEQKWGQRSALTLLLPHGYEGQGPEHSSARIERFLILSGDNNWFIVNPTTPAQLFHALRRQVFLPVKKPLVVFTPKGLLRHPQCQSSRQDFVEGKFEYVMEDSDLPDKTDYLILCSGRIYYDIKQELEKHPDHRTAILRIEQLYPFPEAEIQAVMHKYNEIKKCLWMQEEPCNMGSWTYVQPLLHALLPKEVPLVYIGRDRSASTAAGSYALHKKQNQSIWSQLKHNLQIQG